MREKKVDNKFEYKPENFWSDLEMSKQYEKTFDTIKPTDFDYFKKLEQENKAKFDRYFLTAFENQKKFINQNPASKAIYQPILKIDNYMDNVEAFYNKQPFFYDRQGIFWFWNFNDNKYELVDDVDVMNSIERQLGFGGLTVSSTIKNNYLEAFKRVGRNNIPENAPSKWIQFKDIAYSLESGNIYKVASNYFFTNPIEYELGDNSDTPTMDKLFEEWVGKDYVQTLYEIVAYCCYCDYPIQTMICLFGDGRNGKSTFLKILQKFLGKKNICSTELDLLTGTSSSRFETFKLYKKLVCLMGETNFGVMNKSSILKRLTGGDLMGFEMKNKNPFDDVSYAKLIIASNSLPTAEDTTEGFYRRWIIIDFYNKFPEGHDIFKDIPDAEFNALAKKVTEILPELLKKGEFTNQGTIEERKQKYIMCSNPIPTFIKECCIVSDEAYISYNELYNYYLQYLKLNNKRRVKRPEFKMAIENEGFWVEKLNKKDKNGEFKGSYWIEGIDINCDICDILTNIPTYFPIYETNIEIRHKSHKCHKIWQKCSICGSDPCSNWHKGKPICSDCSNNLKINNEMVK